MIILSNSLMLNPGALLMLAFKEKLYDNSRKMGNPVSPASTLCIKAKKGKKASQRFFSLFR